MCSIWKNGGWQELNIEHKGSTCSVWLAQAGDRFTSSTLRLNHYLLHRFFIYIRFLNVSVWVCLYMWIFACYMESISWSMKERGSMITLNSGREKCNCEMCACIFVFMCVCVYGHMLWWLHCKGIMLMLKSRRAIMHCCMMGVPFTFYIWAREAGRHKHTGRGEYTEWKEQRTEKKLVKNGRQEIVRESEPRERRQRGRRKINWY